MASINTYVSFKRVPRFPNSAVTIAKGALDSGPEFVLGMDPDEAALLLETETRAGAPLRLRVGLQRFVNSVVAAEAADADRWEPLVETSPGRWGNTQLTVHVQRSTMENYIQISYHRRDRAPIRDWRIGQRLKNQLAGPEWEGMEIYPAESRVVDTSNEYHLFCVPQIPFGFDAEDRLTQDQLDDSTSSGAAVQRDDPDADTSRFDASDSTTYRIRLPVLAPDTERAP